MIEFETEVLEIIPQVAGVKSFRFKLKDDVSFKPGQFFFVNIKVDGTVKAKHFSFSNSPTEKGYVEFTKRITASDYSQALEELKPGAWAKLKMPFGAFTFEGEYGKAAFLSGGIGITPIRSICKYATDKGLTSDIVLVYGNNTAAEIIFRQDLDQMAGMNKRLRVVYTLTSPVVDRQKWSGRTGFIDEQMLKEEIPDYRERVFYICGPPKMVEGLGGILKNKLNLTEDKIKIENFTGY